MASYTSVPFLPGMSPSSTAGKNRFHKSQLLTFHNEVANIDNSKPGIGGFPSRKDDLKLSAYPVENGQPAQAAWLAFDRQVLRFYGHFQETVQETNGENSRYRYCTVLFYLEDDTIQVNERVTDNSGLNQGTLIRRHRIPKPAPNDDKFHTVSDLNVGREVTLYGRTFLLTSCDDFTTDFLGKLGIRVGGFLDAPVDRHTEMLKTRAQTERQPLRPYEKVDTLKQFLEHDRQVLRFYCLWDDTRAMFGDKRYMVLHYFLADDTVEVREVLPQNSGRDGTGIFYSRQKLPRDYKSIGKLPGKETPRTVLNVFTKGITDMKSRQVLDSLRTGGSEETFYHESGLQIGAVVQLCNRGLLLCDCDEFTKNHYSTKYGINDFTPVNVEEPAAGPGPRSIPPPTGYGTEDDSMVSVNRLVLQPPKKFPGAYLPQQSDPSEGGNVLRWFARMGTTDPLKVDRRFIISYFLVDDTISVYEKHQRNSGMRGGKFLERVQYKTADGSRFWSAPDFYKGTTIDLQAHSFILLFGDDYTYNFMEKQAFPYSNAQAVTAKVAASAGTKNALMAKRPREDGTVDAVVVRDMLLTAQGGINEQEAETLVRAFGVGHGLVDVKSLTAQVA